MSQLARVQPQPEIPSWENENEERSTTRRKRRFSLSRSRIPLVLVVLLLVYLAFTFTSQFGTIVSLQRDVQAIETEIADMKRKNEALHNELRNVKSNYNIEKSARKDLGLVKTGETRVIFAPGGATGTTSIGQ